MSLGLYLIVLLGASPFTFWVVKDTGAWGLRFLRVLQHACRSTDTSVWVRRRRHRRHSPPGARASVITTESLTDRGIQNFWV